MPRLAAVVGLFFLACQGGQERPSPAELVRPSSTGDPDRPDGTVIDTGADGGCGDAPLGEFCGQIFLREVDQPPNLYFVVDRSGSMGTPFEGSTLSRLQTARASIADLLLKIGHRVRYGAAVFPPPDMPDSCAPGQEIFPTTRGDPAACAANGKSGPLLQDLYAKLAGSPTGATPTAATLDALLPTLTELEGDTFVVLVTDGAPNCNLASSCAIDECTLNIEMLSVNGQECDAIYNCCDPRHTGENAGAYCVDGAATEAAVGALADAGILTYVIGLPGAEPYAALLDRLATIGGTARGGDTDYYAASDADALRQALTAIGTGVAISCSIDLEEPPDDPMRVNVYFDGEVVPAGETDGWAWEGDRRIVVQGAACERLRSGEVLEARVVFGCDTVVR